MKKLFFLFFILFGISTFPLYAQNVVPQCGYTEAIDALDKKIPLYKQSIDKTYLEGIKELYTKNKTEAPDTIFTIEVVFHILYSTPNQNIPDTIILAQLDALNKAFRHTHQDTAYVREIFKNIASDVGIQFVLAQKTPSGDSTTGIIRKKSAILEYPVGQGNYPDFVKKESPSGSQAWDQKKYLNIWICNMSETLSGYAYPPTSAPNWPEEYINLNEAIQGVVISTRVYDFSRNYSGYKTLIHEVGHYLGLRHVWGDGQVNGCQVDDFIEDTPNSATNSFGNNQNCSYSKNTCNDGNKDLPDMIENYMDYGPQKCVIMFTKQQAALMRNNLTKLRPNTIAKLDVKEKPTPNEPDEIISEWRVFPNPANEMLTIIAPNLDTLKTYSTSITNLLGQQVTDPTQVLPTGTKINTSELPNGFYIIQSFDEKGDLVFRKKIIISRQ